MKSKPDLCKSLIKYDKGPLVGKTNVLFSYGIQEDGNKSCMGYNIPHQTPQHSCVVDVLDHRGYGCVVDVMDHRGYGVTVARMSMTSDHIVHCTQHLGSAFCSVSWPA
ncbi:ORF057 [Infectious spleen and kidney necrosis virus]|nr:ORF057 [Infectious spleen and kidney necrosis virus]